MLATIAFMEVCHCCCCYYSVTLADVPATNKEDDAQHMMTLLVILLGLSPTNLLNPLSPKPNKPNKPKMRHRPSNCNRPNVAALIIRLGFGGVHFRISIITPNTLFY